jgi:hypothetical protein
MRASQRRVKIHRGRRSRSNHVVVHDSSADEEGSDDGRGITGRHLHKRRATSRHSQTVGHDSLDDESRATVCKVEFSFSDDNDACLSAAAKNRNGATETMKKSLALLSPVAPHHRPPKLEPMLSATSFCADEARVLALEKIFAQVKHEKKTIKGTSGNGVSDGWYNQLRFADMGTDEKNNNNKALSLACSSDTKVKLLPRLLMTESELENAHIGKGSTITSTLPTASAAAAGAGVKKLSNEHHRKPTSTSSSSSSSAATSADSSSSKPASVPDTLVWPEPVASLARPRRYLTTRAFMGWFDYLVNAHLGGWDTLEGSEVKRGNGRLELKHVNNQSSSSGAGGGTEMAMQSSAQYGRANPLLVHKVRDLTGLNASHNFTDLGSGIGQVVLQMAATVGCQSFGLELLEARHAAAKQLDEWFQRYARETDIAHGSYRLEHGDFTKADFEERILQSDVLFANNAHNTFGVRSHKVCILSSTAVYY